MATIATMLRERISSNMMRTDQFSVAMDVPTGTMTAYINDHRKIGLKNGRKMIRYFRGTGDAEMADAIIDFLLDISRSE